MLFSLFYIDYKPRQILERMRNEGLIVKETQLAYQIQKLKQVKQAKHKFCLLDLDEWAKQHLARPSDDNEAFVTKFECISEPKRIFRVFISTKRLIGFTQHVCMYVIR